MSQSWSMKSVDVSYPNWHRSGQLVRNLALELKVKDHNQCELWKAVENYFATSTPSLLAALLGFPKAEKAPTDRIGNCPLTRGDQHHHHHLAALDVNQSIGAAAGLDTEGDWPAAITKTLARLVWSDHVKRLQRKKENFFCKHWLARRDHQDPCQDSLNLPTNNYKSYNNERYQQKTCLISGRLTRKYSPWR